MKREKSFELKECTQCGTEYKHYPTKLSQLCEVCTKKDRVLKNRLKPEEHKKHYPLSVKDRKRRYTRLRNALKSLDVMSKEEKTEYWDNLLQEIKDMGIMEWCTDLRHPVKPLEPGSGKVGRKPNNGTDPKKKWPDTRMKYEEL